VVIDTSALLAILSDEPGRRSFNEAIEFAESPAMSAATFVETSIVIEARFGSERVRDLDHFLGVAGIDVVAVAADQAHVARHAFSKCGKGRHPAALNFGDCFSYALVRPGIGSRLVAGDGEINQNCAATSFSANAAVGNASCSFLTPRGAQRLNAAVVDEPLAVVPLCLESVVRPAQ
jgi:ribonuclease VapC